MPSVTLWEFIVIVKVKINIPKLKLSLWVKKKIATIKKFFALLFSVSKRNSIYLQNRSICFLITKHLFKKQDLV